MRGQVGEPDSMAIGIYQGGNCRLRIQVLLLLILPLAHDA